MKYSYKTSGTCSSRIDFEIGEDGILSNVAFTGGCNGNLKAIGKLVEGKNARDIASLLKGNTCGFKSTSCADQLSRAIDEALGA
ncbi:MAG: TIGR03905 family TSCPD domain-containing protein [Clostridia bacterium]|nr:TIGR03905 family TSCPD domain-containing protein [Clostridia bacterium]MBQ5356118.1 TIGR03905 family TSCPD domain-containing protein [Clostridia bacterium]